MYSPVTDEFLASLRGSGKRVVTADLYYGGSLVRAGLPVYSGHISIDASADIRRSAQVQMVNPNAIVNQGSSSGLPDETESNNEDPFSVYGYEMKLKYGVEYASGNQELVPLGFFVIWTSNRQHDAGDIYDLDLYDRSKYMQASQIPKFYDASSKAAQTAIQELVTAIMPTATTVTFDGALTNPTLPGGTTYDSTYLDAVLDICESIGAEFYFDVNGDPQCAPKPFIDSSTLASQSVFTANCGDDGVNITIGKQTSRDNIFNGIGCTGSTPDAFVAQAYGEAFDLDPDSPTYYDGPFGKQFRRIDRPELTTPAACLAAAQAELNNSIGRANGVELQILPQPHLEPGDIITVTYFDDTEELHLIDSIEFDLATSEFSVSTKGRNS